MRSAKDLLSIAGYGLAAATQAGVALITVPILTRLLGPQEFGAWVLYEPLMAFVAQIGLFGANHGLLKLVGEDGWTPLTAWRQIVLPAMVLVSGAGVVAGFAAWLLAEQAGTALPLVLLVMLEGFTLLSLAALRAANLSIGFAAVVMGKALSTLAMLLLSSTANIPHLATAEQMLWWCMVPATVGACIGYGAIHRVAAVSHHAHANGKPYRAAVTYGAPLMAASMTAAITAAGDRYVLAMWLPLNQIGAYVVLVKIATAINLLAMPLNMWFPAARYRHLRDPDGGEAFFSATALKVMVTLSTLGSVLWLAGGQLTHLLNPAQSFDGVVAALLLVAAVCNGMTGVTNVGLLKSGKTGWTFVIVLVAAITQFLILAATVRVWGIHGAALAVAIAALLTLTLQNAVSQRIHRLNYGYMWHLAWILYVCTASFTISWFNAQGWLRWAAVGCAIVAPCAMVLIKRPPQPIAGAGHV